MAKYGICGITTSEKGVHLMTIRPEVRVSWDQETVDQVELALKSLPESLHPAVWYVGELIASIRASMNNSDIMHGVGDISDIFEEYGINPDEVREESLQIRLEEPEMLKGFIRILDALRQGDYGVVSIFFKERLRILECVVSSVAASVDDLMEAQSYVERNQPEIKLLQNIVMVLSGYVAAPSH